MNNPDSVWPKLAFSEASQINPKVDLDRGAMYPFVGMTSLSADSRSVHSGEERAFKGTGSRFQNGDTLMARMTPCLENGKIARYQALGEDEAAHGSTEFIVIRGRPYVTDNDFVYYLTQSSQVRDFAIGQMTGTSGRQRVPTDALDNLMISLPPLEEQRDIARILGTLDDKIGLNRRMSATLEEMARALFKSWFVDFDPVRAKADGRPSGLPPGIDALFPASFEPSELGEIPTGWQVRSLDDIAQFTNGLALQRFPPDGNDWLPVIKIAEMRNGLTDRTGRASADIDSRYIVEDGDLLFSWSGSLELVLWTKGRGALNQHLFKITSEEFPRWFYWGWTREHLNDFREIAAGKTTTMGHIRRHHLADAKVVVPPIDLVSAGNGHCGSMVESQVSLAVQSRTLAEQRDALLPRLISGELRTHV